MAFWQHWSLKCLYEICLQTVGSISIGFYIIENSKRKEKLELFSTFFGTNIKFIKIMGLSVTSQKNSYGKTSSDQEVQKWMYLQEKDYLYKAMLSPQGFNVSFPVLPTR